MTLHLNTHLLFGMVIVFLFLVKKEKRWRRVCERSFEEKRRRAKVIPPLLTEIDSLVKRWLHLLVPGNDMRMNICIRFDRVCNGQIQKRRAL
jgi:hypothetical protein